MSRFSLGYRPALDGVRALAALGVVVYHAPGAYVAGGWVGVDLFFVLSGFLITAILLEEHARTGRIAFGRFFERRARRLVPALVLVLIAVMAGELLLFGAIAYWPTAHAIRVTLFYHVNWVLAWQDQAIPGVLVHCWSLAVEEQFYLTAPFALAGVLAWRRGRGALAWLALAGVLTVWAWRVSFPLAGPDFWARVYYGTDTRADGLLLGVALAAAAHTGALERVPAWVRRVAALAGAAVLAAVLFGAVRYSVRALAVWGLAAVALASVAVIAELVAAPSSRAARALGWGPLVWLGRCSYGLYLWHMPAQSYVREIGAPVVVEAVLAVGLSLVLAALSYELVERPIRERRAKARPAPVPDAVPVPA